MKPRITKHRFHYGKWGCSGGGLVGIGNSPYEAWINWKYGLANRNPSYGGIRLFSHCLTGNNRTASA